MSAPMTDLLTRLESGAGSDRELDALILCKLAAPEGSYVQQSRFNGEWCVYEKDRPGRPQRTWEDAKWGRQSQWAVTSSLDAALSLVERMLPGQEVELAITPAGTKCNVFVEMRPGAAWAGYKGAAQSPARAACAALLRALDQEPQT